MPEPAQRLHAAAQRLRELGTAVPEAPWRTRWHGQQLHLLAANQPDPGPYPGPYPSSINEWTYGVRTWEPDATADRTECDTVFPDYLKAMHPGVAHAIADLLDVAARSWKAAHSAATQINAEWKPDWHVEPPVDPAAIAGAAAKAALAVADVVLAGGQP